MGGVEVSEYSKSRGDRLVTRTTINLKLSRSFGDFASGVSSALRSYLLYRTDGGYSARKMMQESVQLKNLHSSYFFMPDGTAIRDWQGLEGQPIRVGVEVFLRKDESNCWKTVVYFKETNKIKLDGEKIEVDNTPPIQKVLGCANMYAKDIKGREGVRIRAMLKIIDQLLSKSGELDALNVWYYAPGPMIKYSSWRTHDTDRIKMTAADGGKLPFKGDAGYPFEDWRIMPIRTMVYDFYRFQGGSCNSEVRQRLLNIDREIYQSFVAINKERDIAGPLIDQLSQIPGGRGKIYGALAEKFFIHLRDLQNDKNHLYYAFGSKIP